MKQPEYIEGPKALENFKRLATTVLRATKRGKRKDKPIVFRRKAKSSGTRWQAGWHTFTFKFLVKGEAGRVLVPCGPESNMRLGAPTEVGPSPKALARHQLRCRSSAAS